MKSPLLRWVLLLPAIFLSLVVSEFALHIVLYKTLSIFVKPYPELPERFLTPLISSFIIVYTAYKIAPKHKLGIVFLFSFLVMLLVLLMVVVALTGGHILGVKFFLRFKGFELLIALIGVVAAIFVTFTDYALKYEPETIKNEIDTL